MRARAGLIQWILGADAIPRPAEVQPHLVAEPGIYVQTDPNAVAVYAPIQTTALMADPIVGYNVPTITRIEGDLPPGIVVDGGVPMIRDNNAPSGGC